MEREEIEKNKVRKIKYDNSREIKREREKKNIKTEEENCQHVKVHAKSERQTNREGERERERKKNNKLSKRFFPPGLNNYFRLQNKEIILHFLYQIK